MLTPVVAPERGFGLATKVTDEQRHMLQGRVGGVNAERFAEAQILIEAAAIGVDGGRGSSKVVEDGQPGATSRIGGDEWVPRPKNLSHANRSRAAGRRGISPPDATAR